MNPPPLSPRSSGPLLRVERSGADPGILFALAILPFVTVLRLAGIVRFPGPDWPLYLGSGLCLLAAVPVLLRWLSSTPLIEIDASHVSVFVGRSREARVQIPRAALRGIALGAATDERVLCLLFEPGALRALREFPAVPYLSVQAEEITVSEAQVRGPLERVVDQWLRLSSVDSPE